MSHLGIYINDQLTYEYDRSTEIDDKQQEFLNKMDGDMDRGFRIYGEMISEPNSKQKATFIAMNLLKALQQEDHAKMAVSCAYLSTRLPDVDEVHARDKDDRIIIEFIEANAD